MQLLPYLESHMMDRIARLDAIWGYDMIKADIVLSIKPTDLSDLSPCQQEEADTRMMLHLRHAVDQGRTKAYLRTVDSDVVVLAIHFFHDLGLSELCIGFGSGKAYRGTQKCWDCNVVKLCPSAMLLQLVTLCP